MRTTVHPFPVPPVPTGVPKPYDATSGYRPSTSANPASKISQRPRAASPDVVFGRVSLPIESRPDPSASDRDALYGRIHAYIEQNLGDETLGVASLQTMFRLSRATLYVLFENEGGVVRHIRECRLRAACHYLRQHPECSLTWLLYELGFTNERQFQRAFHARFGLSPARWRRQ